MLSPMMMAQSLSVTDFKARENDLTANTYGTMERDQNNEVAALIRVQTTQQGFVFSAGMMGIVKTKIIIIILEINIIVIEELYL